MSHSDEQSVVFPGVFSKRVEVSFDRDETTSDGGAILLRSADARLGVTDRVSEAIVDWRAASKVTHDVGSLVRQRVFQIAAGYEDCIDSDYLREDPIFTRLKRSGRHDESELASQSTLSRFENGVSSRDLVRMGHGLADAVIGGARRRYGKKRVRRVILDLDPTCDPVHGGQQLGFFHGFYDSYCYLPMGAFVSFDGHPEKHLVAAMLRSGQARDYEGAVHLMRRLLPKLRESFPRARILVRLDGGFCVPEVLGFLDDEPRVDYVVNLPKNQRILDMLEVFDLMDSVRKDAYRTGRSAPRFGELRYQAKKWEEERRVIVKADVALADGREPKDNPRFVVTNLRQSPAWVYSLYAKRGDVENRLKELKNGMAMGRTSCSNFFANQFRVMLTAAAYVLMQEIRLAATNTDCQNAQVDTLRLRLLKIGARVVESVRRIVLHCPKHHRWREAFRAVAAKLDLNPA